MNKKPSTCPCGGGHYFTCCRPFHEGVEPAPTAQALMRSRYSAYALGLETYLLQTWHPSTRPAALDVQAELTQGKWLGLNIRGHAENGDDAWVEFVARYKPKSGPATRLHECSRFVREQDQWLYLDGEFDHSQKAS